MQPLLKQQSVCSGSGLKMWGRRTLELNFFSGRKTCSNKFPGTHLCVFLPLWERTAPADKSQTGTHSPNSKEIRVGLSLMSLFLLFFTFESFCQRLLCLICSPGCNTCDGHMVNESPWVPTCVGAPSCRIRFCNSIQKQSMAAALHVSKPL